MTADLDVIIVNYNTRDELAGCLESLDRARPACLARIVVVDNGSSDGSVALVHERWPDVTVIPLDRNVGFAAANNVALRRSGATLALLLNSDTVVPEGAIDLLRSRLIERDAAAAGPRLVAADGRPEISFGSMLTPLTEWRQRRRVRAATRPGPPPPWLEDYLANERFVDWVSGACLLVRRDAAAAAGFFDERYFMYEEDVDLCAALRARGGRILYTPLATVTHLRGRAMARAARPPGPSHYDRSHLAFYEKHAPRWAPFLRAWLRLRGRTIR